MSTTETVETPTQARTSTLTEQMAAERAIAQARTAAQMKLRQRLMGMMDEVLDEEFAAFERTLVHDGFQRGVRHWVVTAFGESVADDMTERTHRFTEEALELAQAAGATAEECHQLVDYVFGRPRGDVRLEVGGVMTTLASLCAAAGLSMDSAGRAELDRVWGKIEEIRRKQATKPRRSPLPGATPPPAAEEAPRPRHHGAIGRVITDPTPRPFRPAVAPEQPAQQLTAAGDDVAMAGPQERELMTASPPSGSASPQPPATPDAILHAGELTPAEVHVLTVRQKTREQFSRAHDDGLDKGQLALGAAAYILTCWGVSAHNLGVIRTYPNLRLWDDGVRGLFTPRSYRENLVRAAALLIDEIDRIDRANPSRDD